MADDLVPVLWLTGPAGVGKSTVCWQIFTELAQAGFQADFVDTDQLCMCYPAPQQDPGRQLIKAQNFAAMLPHFQAAGAGAWLRMVFLIQSAGCTGSYSPMPRVTVCRLRADRAELGRRFVGRRRPGDDLGGVLKDTLDEADALDLSDFADVSIDTSRATVAEVVGLVRDSCPTWPGFTGTLPDPPVASGRGASVGDGVAPDGADPVARLRRQLASAR